MKWRNEIINNESNEEIMKMSSKKIMVMKSNE